jgi:hypothetical protein
MNKKIIKLGLSALCGSLATVASAYAGSMEVTGSANATWLSKDGQVDGNPLGQTTALTFKGSGELDGGQTFTATMALGDKAAWSSAGLSLTTNSVGTFNISQAEGGGVGSYDDNMPRANQEVTGGGVGTGHDNVKGVGSSAHLSWTSPTAYSTKLILAWTPKNDATQSADKATSGETNGTKGSGYDVVLDINPQWDAFGINLFGGYSRTDRTSKLCDGCASEYDPHQEGTAGLILTLGPIEVGAQRTFEHLGNTAANEVDFYANASYGVAFNVNDNLSASYSYYDSARVYMNQQQNERVKMEGDSAQIAYTMGGLTVAYSHTDVENAVYNTAKDYEANLISLTLAF